MYEFKELSFNTKCASCPKRDTLQVHHVVSKQQLKKMGRKDLLWDRQNGLPLCELCHARHESAFKRVLRDNLRPENIDFALELDLGWYIERHYPKKEE